MDKIYCPVNGWDCPYFNKDCSCALSHPEEVCDDFIAMEDKINLLEEGYHIVNDAPMKPL